MSANNAVQLSDYYGVLKFPYAMIGKANGYVLENQNKVDMNYMLSEYAPIIID
jgi:hypothetical protein